MAYVNKVMLLGKVTHDPKMTAIASGKSVLEFAVAVNRPYNQNGEKKEETAFVDIVVWGQEAELCNRCLSKGSSVHVEGRLQQDKWTDKATGQNRSKLLVRAERVQFLDGKSTPAQEECNNGMEQF